MKEIKGALHKGIFHVYEFEDSILLRMVYSPNWESNPAALFLDKNLQADPKFLMENTK